MKDYIERPLYIDRIKPYIGKSLIKVITGQRRVGKSCMLMQVRDLIREKEPDTIVFSLLRSSMSSPRSLTMSRFLNMLAFIQGEKGRWRYSLMRFRRLIHLKSR